MNGITSGYRWHFLEGNGSGVSSGSESSTGMRLAQQPAANATANAFGSFVIDIPDAFETTKYKTFRSLSGMTSGSNFITLFSGFHETSAAMTEVSIYSQTGNNLATGSRFSLYGIKAA
jgi:hypothetical protein